MNSKISVIIPVFNVEKYLERCIRSIISSSYENLEIIFVDDGSTDNSLKVLKAQTDRRIVILEKENGGVSSARNAGMSIATGEFISFVDADDWIHTQYFELLYQAIGEAQLSHCNMVRCSDYDANAVTKREEEQNRRCISNTQALHMTGVKDYVWGKLYRKQILEGIRFSENVKMAEDRVFLSEVLDGVKEVSVIDNKLYYYYSRPDSTVHTICSDLMPAAKAHLAAYNKRKNPIMLENAYTTLFACRYLNMYKPNRKEIAREAKELLAECRRMSGGALSKKKQIMFAILTDFPIIYRMFRILTDHTLLTWEIEEKKRRWSKRFKK